ncbi:MAG: helix-turn-helix domain-containing protein [Bryobacterales bacterium]|nr:helix-turn-helix domain-containing protein [Bryobacterales bacterium]
MNSTAQLPTLLDVRAVAAILNCSMPTIYRLAANGGLPVVRVANRVLFVPGDIRRYVEQRRARL